MLPVAELAQELCIASFNVDFRNILYYRSYIRLFLLEDLNCIGEQIGHLC